MAGWKATGTAVCDVCGRTFTKQARNQKTCSKECKTKKDAARKRAQREDVDSR